MGGDVWQWNEANIDDYGRGLRGGNWTYGSDGLASSNRSSYFPADEVNDHGFRVAMVPEPGSIMLAVAGGVCLLAYAWRQRRRLSRPTPMILVAVVVLGLLDSRPALAVNYSAVVLDSGGFYDTRVSGVAGTQQVGEGYMSTPNGDTYHALLWNGASQRVDLNPAGYIGSIGCGTNGTQQVGYGWTNATSVSPHAFLWNGTAQSVVDLTPAGFGWAEAWGIDGTQQIGYGGPTGTIHAMLWSGTAQSAVDLNPAGCSVSYGLGVSGTQEVGYGYFGPQTSAPSHALLWNGTAQSAVDLNPTGFNDSCAMAISGTREVGYGTIAGGGDHALLWSGAAQSAIDLNPAGCSQSYAYGISGTYEVGGGVFTGGNEHALLWDGTAQSVVDLQQFLPAGFTSSVAQAIDAQGDIVGYAYGGSGYANAVLWQPVVPEPSTFALLGIGAISLLGYGWRRRV